MSSSRGRGQGRGRGHKPSGSAPPLSGGINAATSSDKHRKKKMRDRLGGGDSAGAPRDVSGRQPKTHLLVINGGGHSAFLGDFFGLLEFFQKKTSPKFSADFMTVVSPEEYFQGMGKDFTTIKFDGHVVLSKHGLEHYEQTYRYIEPSQMCLTLYQWVAMKADPTTPHGAQSGDSIAIIIMAHGVWSREPGIDPICMRLGTNNLVVGDFVDALRGIPRDIQVNVISTACYSAIFAQKIQEDGQEERWIQLASQPEERAFPADRSASQRFQNSNFIAGLVRSLAGLGMNNFIELGSLQIKLGEATQSRADEDHRSTPYFFTDSALTTKVHSLLLRKFADFPFTPENSAARRRRELNIELPQRPFPDSAAAMDKVNFALELIVSEHESFGSQDTIMDEGHFEEATRLEKSRVLALPSTLRGIFIRGRLQAAVFDVYLELCLAGVCSLNALQLPVRWNRAISGKTCLSWIWQMLHLFSEARQDWQKVQENWQIEPSYGWFEYKAPVYWLATMLARSFISVTSLSRAFDIIRITGQLGRVDAQRLEKMIENFQPDVNWVADMSTNKADKFQGSGTFACWLPENVDASILDGGFDKAALKITKAFQEKLERMEMHYAVFFGISRNEFDADVQDGERDVRDWKGLR